MRTKKVSALVLAFLIALCFVLPIQSGASYATFFSTPSAVQVFGRRDYRAAARAGLNAQVEEKRAEIERRFGVHIRYDIDQNGTASIGIGALITLDTTLGHLTPAVIRQLSDYWEGRTGNRLSFSFVYSPFQNYASIIGGEVLGSFNPHTAVIQLYIPAFAADVFISGESPLTIMHEVAHAVQLMLDDLHGAERLRAEWETMNNGIPYTGPDNNTSGFDRFTFVSQYSVTSFEEDFAEVFAHAFVRHSAGQGFSNVLWRPNGEFSPLGRKVDYLESLLPLYFNDSEQMMANYRRVWTAPIFLQYGNLNLSGDFTQYIGFSHPRFVLRSLVDMLEIEMEAYRWVSHIGGWIISDTNGAQFAIFPGGIAFHFTDQP